MNIRLNEFESISLSQMESIRLMKSVDKIICPKQTDIRLGHYSLPELNSPVADKNQKVGKYNARIISNSEYQLAMIQ